MFLSRFANSLHSTTISFRQYSLSTKKSLKVAVLGAAGGIGQPLSLLCKLSNEVDELSCYDVVGTPGLAADLSHIPTKANTTGLLPSPQSWPFKPNDGLANALTGANVVIIPAGVPRKPGMTRDDLFNTNASIVKSLVEGCAEFCPDAILAIISNPVNSTVPIAAEVLKKKGVYDKNKLCGVTTLDVLRANTFLAENQNCHPKDVNVTVIGGHAGTTILPLFSQVRGLQIDHEDINALTVRTQFGGDEVVQAKAGSGSATLSMAYAGYLFTQNLLKAMKGEHKITQCAYVESDLTGVSFFAGPCRFGERGVEEVLDFGELSVYEKSWYDKMLPDLKHQIQKGIDFVKK